MEAARFEARGDATRSAGPAGDAIERMPAVIEEDAAARHRRIDAPVCDAGADQRRPQAESAASANARDRTAPIAPSADQRRDLEADRRIEPVVNRMDDTPGARGGRRDGLSVRDAGDQRLLAQHVKTRVERLYDERRMAPGGAQMSTKSSLSPDSKIVKRVVPPPVGTRGEKRLPARRGGVGRRDNLDIDRARASRACGPLAATFPKPMNAPRSTALAQSSPNRREMAAKD